MAVRPDFRRDRPDWYVEMKERAKELFELENLENLGFQVEEVSEGGEKGRER